MVKADGTDESRYGKWLVDVSPQGPRLGDPIVSASGLQTWYSHGSALPSRVPKTFTSLAWSPDGKTLAFSSDMDPSGYNFLWTVAEDGTYLVRIDESFSPSGPNDKLPIRAYGKLGLIYEMPAAAMHGRTLLSLPEKWLFCADPQDIGEKQCWFDPSADLSGFKPISTHRSLSKAQTGQ